MITGASRGIGLAIASRLNDLGYQVLGLARNCGRLSFQTADCDVSDASGLLELAKEVRLSGAKVSSLINAAGVASTNFALSASAEVADKVIKTNLLGTIYACQAFAPLLIRQGYGRIINFSSIAVSLGIAGESMYAASKAGVEAFSRSFAKEISPVGITVNCIAPGPIPTEMLQGVTEDQISSVIQRQVIRKQFGTNDVCDVVELLLDARSASISGQVIHVGGV